MGSRANYIVIHDGKRDIYYSHWGAMHVPAVVINGPGETLAYIRGLALDDQLLDTTWAEGGVLVDVDTQTLLFWGGESIMYDPYRRRVLAPALRLRWPGWTVAWATHGQADLAEYIGLPPTSVIAPWSIERRRAPATALWNPPEPGCATVITVKWESGRITDHCFLYDPDGVVLFGAELLSALREKQPDTLPDEAATGEPIGIAGGAYADVTAHALWVWQDSTLNPAYLAGVTQVWPDWRVEGHVDGLARQVALSWRDPALVMLPVDRIITELVAELGDDDDFDTAARARTLLSGPANLDDSTQFAPGFFRMDRPLTSAAERRERLTRLFAQVVERRDSDDGNER